ncbi:hypothetical protein KY49_741 [Burkholderia sp. MSHR3999]|uniref:hypothetical protein n=1 Tax=Burkholderia sp. MSHR3999 TaxID=1542965 RepID=UPI0005AC6605|nr:hypothetical protein [Burkholderia sp. MSHR3999]KIP14598.1 hypothetical protein KY49_741 [Burkholderia sp. MSHR3999]
MPITQEETRALEATINEKLAVHKTAFKMSVHFSIDRLNDPRNNPPITIAELESIFDRLIDQHIMAILVLNDKDTFNIRCQQSDINIPCGVQKVTAPQNSTITQKNIVITIMRKRNFFAKDAIEFQV